MPGRHIRAADGPTGGGPTCRKAQPDRLPDKRFGWTVDLCANAVFNLRKRPVEHYPEGQVPRRRWEYCTTRPIRGEGFSIIGGGGGEPCRYHYARLVKCPDNRWRPMFCTRPDTAYEADDAGRTMFSVANFFARSAIGAGEGLATSGPPQTTLIKPGRTGALAGYHTPMWTELLLTNTLRYCDPLPV